MSQQSPNEGSAPVSGATAVDRRKLLVGAAAVATTSGFAAAGSRAFAQDASPAAEPQSEAAGSSEANAIGSDRFPTRTELGPAIPPEYTDDETNWPSQGADLAATRQAMGSTISTETIADLGWAWSVPIDVAGGFGALVASPTIVGDMLYVQDAMSNVYAVNKTTGESAWTIEHNETVPAGGPNGTAAGYGHIVYTVGGPADVIAVTSNTGEEVWRTNVKGLRNEGITMAPMVYDSTVYVSTIPGTADTFYDGNQRGFIIALDLVDGKILWYFDTTVDNLWGADGGNARINSGGGLWHPPSIDEEGNVYVGVGNASPYPGIPAFPAGSSREGDNDYANAIIRIDPDRAAVDWFVNVKPHDLFDLDNQLTPILTTANIDGADTRIAITSGKHGYVVAVDQETGEEYWRTAVGEHMNDDLQELPEDEFVEVLPGTLGGVETPMAYAEGVVFAPIYNMSSFYSASEFDATSLDISRATGQLVALDAATGEILWDVAQPTGLVAAATVTNDVVYTGGLDGVIHGYNVSDGTEVFSYQATAGVNAPLAASGDYLYIPAGGPLVPSADTSDPAPEVQTALIALKIGGDVQVTGSASPEAEQATPVEDGAAGDVTVNMVDIAYEPREFTIAADTDVVVNLVNNGALQHDFIIDELGMESDLLDGGASRSVTINAPAGTYEYYCSVAGHREAGMIGTLTVE